MEHESLALKEKTCHKHHTNQPTLAYHTILLEYPKVIATVAIGAAKSKNGTGSKNFCFNKFLKLSFHP